MQLPKNILNNPTRRQWITRGLVCLLLLVTFFVGQFITQFTTTAPYSARNQAISTLGITTCGNFTEQQTNQRFYVCSPLHLVMDGTFVVSGLLIMVATTSAIAPLWPGKKLRTVGLTLVFFGGIEEVVAGFSPLDLNPFLHSLSGGLAIAALNIGLVLLGFAALRAQPKIGWFALLFGTIGIVGFMMTGTTGGLGYGGWERVAGYAFPLWGMAMGVYWTMQLRSARKK